MNNAKRILTSIARCIHVGLWEEAGNGLSPYLQDEKNWKPLLHLSGSHRLLGYLAELTYRDPAVRKLSIRDEVKRTLDGLHVRYAYQCTQLAEILLSLEDRDITSLVLKGIPLAEEAHAKPFLRTTGDIDLLVPPERLIDSIDCLIAHGFRLVDDQFFPWPPPRWLENSPMQANIDEICLHRGGIVVEVHTDLISHKLSHHVNPRELFEKKVPFKAKSFDVSGFTLSPEHFWIHLAVNHHMHRFSGGLGVLLDLANWETLRRVNCEKLEQTLLRWNIAYLIIPVLEQLMWFSPDLPSTQQLHVGLNTDDRIFDYVEHVTASKPTPFFWIRKGPTPLRTLARNVFLSRFEAALRYGRHPHDPRLWLNRIVRPFELWRRHHNTWIDEIRGKHSSL